MQCLFAFNYMDAGHEPVATDLPFGVVGSSPILTQAEKQFSLKVTVYPNESAAKTGIDKAQIWGALIPAGQSGGPDTLIVVPTSSDLAPLDIAVQFQDAAKKVGQKLTVQQYAPVPLPKKDPFGLVQSLMLIPLLIGGYMSATLLMAATGTAARRWRLVQLTGFAIVAGLAVDLVVGVWLQGYAGDKFWIVWPICSLIIAAVAFVAAVLQKLLGAAGTLLTIIVIILFGNPSIRRRQRSALPTHLLARHRALPTTPQRLHPAAPDNLFRRPRNHTAAAHPARLPRRRRDPPRHPRPPPHRSNRPRRHRRSRSHGHPHWRRTLTGRSAEQ